MSTANGIAIFILNYEFGILASELRIDVAEWIVKEGTFGFQQFLSVYFFISVCEINRSDRLRCLLEACGYEIIQTIFGFCFKYQSGKS